MVSANREREREIGKERERLFIQKQIFAGAKRNTIPIVSTSKPLCMFHLLIYFLFEIVSLHLGYICHGVKCIQCIKKIHCHSISWSLLPLFLGPAYQQQVSSEGAIGLEVRAQKRKHRSASI